MLEVADVFRRYGEDYLAQFGDRMPKSHRRAIQDILNCRTETLGGHLYACDHCGHHRYAYHSCRNRHCPKCHTKDIEAWLDQRRQELLPVSYFHVVFTIPEELRRIVRHNPKILYSTLMKASAKALMKLAADPKYVGGRIGILAVLHTWTRTLEYHPHVHCLVPAGGVSNDGTWLAARANYLVPVKALSKIFRELLTSLVRKALPHLELPQSVWKKDWVVYCKSTVQGTDKLLEYLGRYVHRVAISNSRILSIDDGKVTFRYHKVKDSRCKTMTLSAQEFMRRFLQHVLPQGVHKVRYYGLWSPSKRAVLQEMQNQLANNKPVLTPHQSHDLQQKPQKPVPIDHNCPVCGKGVFVCIARLDRQWRAPP
jgi:hypothetical protein